MEMREEDIIYREWRSTGTTWTNNELFEKNGYFVIKNLCDPKTLIDDVPVERGTLKWYGNKLINFKHYEKEDQVEVAFDQAEPVEFDSDEDNLLSDPVTVPYKPDMTTPEEDLRLVAENKMYKRWQVLSGI